MGREGPGSRALDRCHCASVRPQQRGNNMQALRPGWTREVGKRKLDEVRPGFWEGPRQTRAILRDAPTRNKRTQEERQSEKPPIRTRWSRQAFASTTNRRQQTLPALRRAFGFLASSNRPTTCALRTAEERSSTSSLGRDQGIRYPPRQKSSPMKQEHFWVETGIPPSGA